MSGMIGGMAGAAGSYNKGKVEHDIAKFNTRIYAANKEAVKAKTQYELLLHSRDVRRTIGTQQAMFAAAGVETSDTPLAIMAETAGMGAEKARLLQYRGDVEAAEWQNKALMSRFQGKVAFKAGQMGAISGAFGGAASGGESAYSMFK
jgi:hypothetical protein